MNFFNDYPAPIRFYVTRFASTWLHLLFTNLNFSGSNMELVIKIQKFILRLHSRISFYFIPGYIKAVYQKLTANYHIINSI